MRRVLLALCLVALTITGFAQDFRTAGTYEGDRDFNPTFQKKLAKYSKKHFELLQAGETKEAAKLYSDKISPLKRKIQGVNKLSGVKIDTQIFSVVPESHGIYMRVSFPPANEKERKASFNNLYFELNLSPEMYLKAFESDQPLKKAKVQSFTGEYPFYLYAKGNKDNREVHIEFVGDLDGTVFKRGVLILRLKKGQFVEAELYRQKKRFHGMLGYATTFAGFAKNLKRTTKGIMLIDEGGWGPSITSPDLIRKALKKENRTGKAFKAIAAQQK